MRRRVGAPPPEPSTSLARTRTISPRSITWCSSALWSPGASPRSWTSSSAPCTRWTPNEPALTADDHLLYRYYGGAALAALGRYREAAEMFLGAIAAPATALSAIVVAAHKKYACVSLIADGAVPPLPRYVPAATQRGLKRCAGARTPR